jgi:circadian clock protein KaiC
VTLAMTHEIHDLFNVGALIDSAISHLADNLVILRYVMSADEVERALIVLKTRASRHDPRIRQFRISDDGIDIRPLETPIEIEPFR